MKIAQRITLICATMMLALFGLASEAFAQSPPVQTINASICMGIDAANQSRLGYSKFGIGNTHVSSWANVVCPLGSAKLSNTEPTTVVAIVFDRDPSNGVSCTLHRQWGDSSDIITPITQTSTGWGVAYQQLTFTMPAMSNAASANYVVLCGIPPQTSSGYSHVTTFYLLP
jgi:hypothetical protein